MIYVISDIHGKYKQFMTLLKKINFSDEDTLYILGDVLDRGENPIKILLYMMSKPNIIPIAGNHELMGLECPKFLVQEITESFIDTIDDSSITKLLDWQSNGGYSSATRL